MRALIIILAATFGLMSSAFANQERPRVDRYAKAFTGGEGIEVVLLGVGKKENSEFLLKISGVNHDWDKTVLKAKKVNQVQDGSKHIYKVTVDGKSYNTLHVRNGNYQVYLPGGLSGVYVSYNKSFSRSIRPQHMLTDYLEKRKR